MLSPGEESNLVPCVSRAGIGAVAILTDCQQPKTNKYDSINY